MQKIRIMYHLRIFLAKKSGIIISENAFVHMLPVFGYIFFDISCFLWYNIISVKS